MKVRIEFYATLREKFGKSVEVDCDGTLKNAFEAAAEKLGKELLDEVFDDGGNFREDRIITVDGRNVRDAPVQLKEGSRIAVFPPIAGGI